MALLGKHLTKIAQDVLYPQLFLFELGEKVPLPGNSGKHIFIPVRRRVRTVGVLTEGTVLLTSAASAHFYSGMVSGFAGGFGYNDFFVATNEIPMVLGQDAKNLGVDMAQKYESAILSKISGSGLGTASTNTMFVPPDGSTAAGSVATTTNMLLAGLFQATTLLRSNNAPTYPDGLFAGVFHPKQVYDLYVNASGTAKFGNYNTQLLNTDAGAKTLAGATLGQIAGIRILQSTNSAKYFLGTAAATGTAGTSAGASSYIGMVLAPGAYACVDLENERPRIIVKEFGSGGATGDPADQKMSQSIKGYFCCVAMDAVNRIATIPSGKTL